MILDLENKATHGKKKASVRAVMPHHVENQSQHRENLLFECFAINNGWKTPRFPLSCYVELKPLQRLRTSKKLEMSCFYQQSDAVRFPSSKAKRHVRFSSLSHVCNTAQLHFAENVRRGSPLPPKKKMRGGGKGSGLKKEETEIVSKGALKGHRKKALWSRKQKSTSGSDVSAKFFFSIPMNHVITSWTGVTCKTFVF